MKNYAERIHEELRKHCLKMSSIGKEFRTGDKLVKKSKILKMRKLLKYANRADVKKLYNAIYFHKMEGRLNRTPWKCKGLPYIAKEKRLRGFHSEPGFLNGK